MSDQIFTLLQSQDPKQRKRGISAAAKTVDTQYLKILAGIVKNDPDEAVREMAKKAGTYIHQNAGKQTVPSKSGETQTPSQQVRIDISKLPQASETDPKQAKIHYDEAFRLHLRKDNARAVLELGTAFFLNPMYANDATAIAFASELTGISKDRVAHIIADPNNWRKLTDRQGGFKPKQVEEGEGSQTLVIWIGAALLVIIIIGLLVVLLQSELFGIALQQSIGNVTGGIEVNPTQPSITLTATPQ
jgi:hypothetical protein